jgi:hypothetical protein
MSTLEMIAKLISCIWEILFPLVGDNANERPKREYLGFCPLDIDFVIEYLYKAYCEENDRRRTIETKSSLVISIFAGFLVFVGNILINYFKNKQDSWNICDYLIAFCLFIFLVYFFISLWHAEKAIDRARYAVLDIKLFESSCCKSKIAEDLYNSIMSNYVVNNKKANHMVAVQKYFKRSLIILAILFLLVFFDFFSTIKTLIQSNIILGFLMILSGLIYASWLVRSEN